VSAIPRFEPRDRSRPEEPLTAFSASNFLADANVDSKGGGSGRPRLSQLELEINRRSFVSFAPRARTGS
jgi:hypothetical protein